MARRSESIGRRVEDHPVATAMFLGFVAYLVYLAGHAKGVESGVRSITGQP